MCLTSIIVFVFTHQNRSLLNDWKKTAENAVGLDIRDTATQKKKKKKKKAKGERDGVHDVVDDINSLVEEKSPLESNLDMEICKFLCHYTSLFVWLLPILCQLKSILI